MALGREGEHLRAARLHLDDVAHGLVEERAIGAEGDDESPLLNEGDGAVLELAEA